MLIVTKYRDTIVNLDNVTIITREATLDESKIEYWADTADNTTKLGEYENTPEHENVIEKIAQSAGAINVFYMPEE